MTERRLTRRGRETRERIVAAAADLIFERGVAETTLEDIRAAAGVSGSQVYHYFEDKQALVRAVMDHRPNAVLDTQGPRLDHLDTLPGLRAWRDLLVEHQRTLECRGGCPIGTLGAEVAEIDDAARMAVARGFGRWEARIRDGLRAMHARGDLPRQARTPATSPWPRSPPCRAACSWPRSSGRPARSRSRSTRCSTASRPLQSGHSRRHIAFASAHRARVEPMRVLRCTPRAWRRRDLRAFAEQAFRSA